MAALLGVTAVKVPDKVTEWERSHFAALECLVQAWSLLNYFYE